jgi:hypothetical protein
MNNTIEEQIVLASGLKCGFFPQDVFFLGWRLKTAFESNFQRFSDFGQVNYLL